MTFIVVTICLFFVLIGYLIIGNPLEADLSFGSLIVFVVLVCFVFSIYYNKDAIKGKGPGKRAIGFIVVNNATGEIANPLRCIIRNFTLVLWPIEVIVTLFSPERRIGDYIAGTKVIEDKKELETEINKGQIALSLFIGCIISLITLVIQLSLQGISLLKWH